MTDAVAEEAIAEAAVVVAAQSQVVTAKLVGELPALQVVVPHP